MAWNVTDYPEPRERTKIIGEGLCPDCGAPYVNHNDGAGVLIDGEALCGKCAMKFFLSEFSLSDFADAFGYRYLPRAEDWGPER